MIIEKGRGDIAGLEAIIKSPYQHTLVVYSRLS
jgi:hypothetical protein